MKERGERRPHPEHEPQPYYRASRFERERRARRAYFSTQETIYKTDCDLSSYRFLLRQVWHVAVIGTQPLSSTLYILQPPGSTDSSQPSWGRNPGALIAPRS